jgi:PAS domain S-box-containing protein
VQRPRFSSLQRIAAVAGPAAVIGVLVVLLFVVMRDVRRQAQWGVRSQDILATLSAVRDGVLDAEAAKRDYLLTGRATFLDAYEAAVDGAESAVARLDQLGAGDDLRSRRTAALAGLVRRKLERLDALGELFDTADDAVLAAVLEANRIETAELRAALEEFRETERVGLRDRSGAAVDRLELVILFVLLGGGAAVLLALLTNLLITRHMTELQETRQNLELALRSARLGRWDHDVRTGATFWDDRTREVLGRPGSGIVSGEDSIAVIHPDDRDAAQATFAATLQPGSGNVYHIEKRVVRPDGSVRHTVWAGLLRRDPAGAPVRLVGTLEDVTEMHEAQEQLRASEERFRVMAEAVPQIVWAATPDGVVDFYNGRLREFTGASAEAAYGEGWRLIVHADHEQATADAWQRAVKTGEPYDIEHLIRRADGEYRWLLSRGVPLRGADGSIIRWFGTATDIHEQKLAEAELRGARDAAEAASRAKSRFLAVISHELRTPLTAIIGFTDLLESGVLGPVTERQREPLRRITASSWGLVQIIDEILTFSRAEAGREQVRPQILDLADLADAVVAMLEPQAAQRGLQLVLDRAVASLSLHSDGGKIRQILTNLIGNAIRFTDHGSITVSVRTAGEAAEVAVRDTGLGIPADMLDQIFEPFTQVDQSNTRDKGGTGLGLAVSRRLARLLGGDVTVESEPGAGSTFTLRLPHLGAMHAQLASPAEDGS